MTAQIHDTLIMEKEKYLVLDSENPKRFCFHAERFGMIPKTRTTACWRGFYSKYQLIDGYLYLTDVHLSLGEDQKYKKINGVIPGIKDEFLGFRHYKNLNLPVPYTGWACIGKDFLNEYYVHYGTDDTMFYKEVYLLYFLDGKLVHRRDVSEEKKELRENRKRKDVI